MEGSQSRRICCVSCSLSHSDYWRFRHVHGVRQEYVKSGRYVINEGEVQAGREQFLVSQLCRLTSNS